MMTAAPPSPPESVPAQDPARRGGRPARPQLTLTVVRREQLGPHLVRVVLGGDRFDEFATTEATDAYVKIVFAKPELGLVPPYDLAALRESGLAAADLPVTRTYTVRTVDPVARELSIDFVVHGDEGLAGPWANAAQPGDTLTFSGPGGAYAPDPAADWHLFAGDLSALPAIAAAIDALPRTALGLAFIEATAENDALVLDAPAGVTVQWLFTGGGHRARLAEAVSSAEWLPGRPQVFAHGERDAMKALRDVFAQRGVLRSELSLSGYWAAGRTEDRFQAEKREPIGAIEPVSD
ncbi:siderophore-interacting protein [Subtercola boreus]|uniref:NADPH-dependent ferric siderophore reductase n=1 Tax=Subtercola boreus TaxID=120213 RepID=A0A3E0WDU2_9MICO|nr:siderophore-interacting protein [Subtercola boreus]RFA23388.1 NADPH-dependent ferric siderophore reductase [Subtercola boreus]RFA23781.1 NADPH-dependent ferric siderophore reductase [Subtercola boreus]RFA29482.1 NADPH-dependent ferric siderophore reductase [Subtercola boreus]